MKSYLNQYFIFYGFALQVCIQILAFPLTIYL